MDPFLRRWGWLLALIVAVWLWPGAARSAPQAATAPAPAIAIDRSQTLQRFDGWGTSLAWWANVAGGYPEADRQRIADQVFDPVKGLGLNLVRYNIGGGENPKLHPLPFRSAIPGYEPAPGAWDWSADANQRYMLMLAIQRGANHLEACAYSPPWWMTVSGSVTGAADGGSNLRPDACGDFANYLAAVVEHFDTCWHITFDTLDPLNEPISRWWKRGGQQEGCHFSRAEQSHLLELTARALVDRHLSTQLSASDENSIDEAVRSLNSLSDAAERAVAQVNTHSYNGSARQQLRELAGSGAKRLWMSEYGDNDATGMEMSERILLDMKNLQPAAWLTWQVADGMGGWGLFRSRENGAIFDWQVNEKFYVLANYARFLRPGCVMLRVDDGQTLAGWNLANKSLAIVSTNASRSDRPLVFDLSAAGFVHPVVSGYRTSEHEQLAPLGRLAVVGSRLSADAPARSITTWVVTDAGM